MPSKKKERRKIINLFKFSNQALADVKGEHYPSSESSGYSQACPVVTAGKSNTSQVQQELPTHSDGRWTAEEIHSKVSKEEIETGIESDFSSKVFYTEEEYNKLKHDNDQAYTRISLYTKQIEELKSRLAEKDKQIQKLKEACYQNEMDCRITDEVIKLKSQLEAKEAISEAYYSDRELLEKQLAQAIKDDS